MIRKCVRLFYWMLIALSVSAICLFAIPLVQERTAQQYMLGGMFWLSLLAEMIFLAAGNSLRRKIESTNPGTKQKRGFGKLGIFCFAQNKEAKIADGLLIAAIIYLAALNVLPVDSVGSVSIGIAGVYLLFHLHCILNGILYKSIKHYQVIKQKRREKK